MWKILTKIILLIALSNFTWSLFLPITGKPLCIFINAQDGKQLFFSYQINGNNPQNAEIQFIPVNPGQKPFKNYSEHGRTIIKNTQMRICFRTTDNGYKSVSIDYYTHDQQHLTDLALKSDIYQLHEKLIQVGQKIKEINRDEIFEQERQSIHSKIIEEHETKLKALVAAKLLVIVVVAGAQLYLLKAMLDKSSMGYQPV